MAVCNALHVTALAVVTLALGNASTDLQRLVEEDTIDLRVEPLAGHHNASLLSGKVVDFAYFSYMCSLDH